MTTIKEVAARANVATGTVSRVLQGASNVRADLRARVLRAVQDLNYEPNQIARSLKSRRTYSLGMIIPDITDPFFPQLTRGAEDAAADQNYVLMTLNTDNQLEREKVALESLKRRQVDGVLLVMAPNGGNLDHINSVLSAKIPVVCLDRVDDRLKVSTVKVDDIGASELCVSHLVSQGHRRIAIITGDLQTHTAMDRFRGFKNMLRKSKIPMEEGFVFRGNFSFESGYWLTKQMCASTYRPTAVFVSNGLMGLGVFKALREMGVQCPNDIAVALFDDLQQGESFSPPITAVAHPSYEIGHKGAELLIEQIERPSATFKPVHITLRAELRVRQSTMHEVSGN
jgi:DNA-binding LacI/PurR family transcriptional regulator